jgi:hypothetical protein
MASAKQKPDLEKMELAPAGAAQVMRSQHDISNDACGTLADSWLYTLQHFERQSG